MNTEPYAGVGKAVARATGRAVKGAGRIAGAGNIDFQHKIIRVIKAALPYTVIIVRGFKISCHIRFTN